MKLHVASTVSHNGKYVLVWDSRAKAMYVTTEYPGIWWWYHGKLASCPPQSVFDRTTKIFLDAHARPYIWSHIPIHTDDQRSDAALLLDVSPHATASHDDCDIAYRAPNSRA
jgi:hypothetical protein